MPLPTMYQVSSTISPSVDSPPVVAPGSADSAVGSSPQPATRTISMRAERSRARIFFFILTSKNFLFRGPLAAGPLIRGYQPFTAPTVRPEMKYFWKNG